MVVSALHRRFNAENIGLRDDAREQDVGVLLASGRGRYVRWLGLIDLAEANPKAGSRAVKIEVALYTNSDAVGSNWIALQSGEYLQGCLVTEGVYGVTVVVRVVSGNTV